MNRPARMPEWRRRYRVALTLAGQRDRPVRDRSALCLVCGTLIDPVSWPVHPCCEPPPRWR